MKQREAEMRDTNGMATWAFILLMQLATRFSVESNPLAWRTKHSLVPRAIPAESTNSRVLYFSVFSMACLVALAGWQIFYLKKFFQTKKLI